MKELVFPLSLLCSSCVETGREERERHEEKMLRYWQPWAKCEKENERQLRWEGNLELKNRWGKGKRQPGLYNLSECSSLLTFYMLWKSSKLEHFSSLNLAWLPSPLVLSISFLPRCEVTQSGLWISKKVFSRFSLFMHKTCVAYLISTEITVTWARAHIMPCFPFF